MALIPTSSKQHVPYLHLPKGTHDIYNTDQLTLKYLKKN